MEREKVVGVWLRSLFLAVLQMTEGTLGGFLLTESGKLKKYILASDAIQRWRTLIKVNEKDHKLRHVR